MACLFLAGKVEDNPKKIYDVVLQFHKEVPKREKLVEPELSDGHVRQLKVGCVGVVQGAGMACRSEKMAAARGGNVRLLQ